MSERHTYIIPVNSDMESPHYGPLVLHEIKEYVRECYGENRVFDIYRGTVDRDGRFTTGQDIPDRGEFYKLANAAFKVASADLSFMTYVKMRWSGL